LERAHFAEEIAVELLELVGVLIHDLGVAELVLVLKLSDHLGNALELVDGGALLAQLLGELAREGAVLLQYHREALAKVRDGYLGFDVPEQVVADLEGTRKRSLNQEPHER